MPSDRRCQEADERGRSRAAERPVRLQGCAGSYPQRLSREFTAKCVREWLGRVGVKTLFIEPGSPWENGYIESFNGKLRDELLEREAFDTLLEAKVLIERWRQHYNTIRPHSALGYRPPAPEAWQPRAFASATPQQTHGAGLLEGKILT